MARFHDLLKGIKLWNLGIQIPKMPRVLFAFNVIIALIMALSTVGFGPSVAQATRVVQQTDLYADIPQPTPGRGGQIFEVTVRFVNYGPEDVGIELRPDGSSGRLVRFTLSQNATRDETVSIRSDPWYGVDGKTGDREGIDLWTDKCIVFGSSPSTATDDPPATPEPTATIEPTGIPSSTSTPTPVAGSAGQGELLSLQSYNFPQRYIRHQSGVGRIDEIASEIDRKTSTFRLVEGLADGTHLSLEAADLPNHFLVVEGNAVVLRERQPGDGQFDENATFIRHPGLSDPALLSLESYAQRGHYVRHTSYVLYVNQSNDTPLFREDATFKQIDPNWPQQNSTNESTQQPDLCADIPASDSPSSAIVRFVNLEPVDVGIHVYPEGQPIAGDIRAVLRPGQTRDVTVYFDSNPYYDSVRLDALWGVMHAGGTTQLLEDSRNDITNETSPCIVFGDPSSTTMPEPTPDPAQQTDLCADIPASDSPSSAIVRFVNLEPVDVGIHVYPEGQPMNGDHRFTMRPGETRDETVYFDSNPYYDSVRLDILWVQYLFAGDINGQLASGFYTRQDIANESPKCIVLGGSSSTITPEPTATPEPMPTPTPVPPSTTGDQPPPLISYTFTSEESKELPGSSTETGDLSGCEGTIKDEDKIGRLAVVTLIYQTGCWTDGRYNHNNYQVERGQVTGSNGTALEAYRLHPPSTLATEFLGSKHAIYYQFPSQEAYTVYTFDGSTTKKVLDIDASQIVADGYTKLDALTISENSEPVAYIFNQRPEYLHLHRSLAR